MSIGAAAITSVAGWRSDVLPLFPVKGLSFSALVSDYGWVHCFWRDYCQRHLRFLAGRLVSALMVRTNIAPGLCYDTSNIIHHYPTDRPAGAALSVCFYRDHVLVYFADFFMSRN